MKKTSFKQGIMTNNISLQNTTCCAQSEGRDAKGVTTIEANPAPPQPVIPAAAGQQKVPVKLFVG